MNTTGVKQYMKDLAVCLLNDSFPPIIDGVANAVVNYAQIIEERYGHAVVVTPSVPEADDSGFDFPVLRYPSIDTRKMVGYVTGYPFSPEVTYRVKEEGSDILHLHCPATSALFARQLKETLNLPLVMTYHTKYDIDIANLVHSNALQSGAIAAMIQNVEACDEVWTVSQGAGENLRSLGFQGDYQVMENGVDMERGRAGDRAVQTVTCGYDIPADVPLFLFVGRIMWYKGLRIILDALQMLQAEKIPFRMVFIGDGTDRPEVTAYAKENRLEKVCFFTGAITDREELRAWYSRADLFLFPSTFDTNGLVVREAAACMLASVLISGSCAAEGVTDWKNGFLVEENAQSMAEMLKKLCKEPEMIRRVGEAAGEDLYISWDEAVGRAVSRYEIILENHRAGKYRKKPKLADSALRLNGEGMMALGTIGAVHHYMNEDREKARETIQAARAEARSKRKKQINNIWQYLDRYL